MKISKSIMWLFFLSFPIFGSDQEWMHEIRNVDRNLEEGIAKKFDLHLSGTGGGGAYGFKYYNPKFQKLSILQKSEARFLILSLSEKMLQQVNSNKVLRKNMRVFPFTHYNAQASIIFLDTVKKVVPIGQIYCVTIHQKCLSYGIKHERCTPDDWEDEPIREALEKVDPTKEQFPFLWECVEREHTVDTID